jgi:dienelactone hydrolase
MAFKLFHFKKNKMKKSLLLFAAVIFSCASIAQGLGHTSLAFTDASRNNRSIPCEVYYPALSAGDNVPALDPSFLSLTGYPAIAVGHGFVIGATSYQLIADQLIPFGFVVALVNTETGFSPSHQEFGLDLAFVTHALQQESLNSSSVLFNTVSQDKEAVIGHSMGGGAAWLAAASDPSIDAIVGLAPAETNPSAIAAAPSVVCNALVFSGSDDTVTPPADNHQPIFDGTNSTCKTFVTLTGGSHCGYIDAGTLCDFGEPLGGSLARADQQQAYLTLMTAWLRHFLNGECVEALYTDYVSTHSFVVTEPLAQCMLCESVSELASSKINIHPNPTNGQFQVNWSEDFYTQVEILDATGKSVYKQKILQQNRTQINEKLNPGIYLVKLSNERSVTTKKLIVN